jgi:hypothetical protein
MQYPTLGLKITLLQKYPQLLKVTQMFLNPEKSTMVCLGLSNCEHYHS